MNGDAELEKLVSYALVPIFERYSPAIYSRQLVPPLLFFNIGLFFVLFPIFYLTRAVSCLPPIIALRSFLSCFSFVSKLTLSKLKN